MTSARFLFPAELELRETVAYLDEQVDHLGDRFAAEVEHAVSLLTKHPRIGASLTKRVRKFSLRTFPYNVIYAPQPEEIVIVAIAHHRRRPAYWRYRMRQIP